MADSIGTAFVNVALDPKAVEGQLGELGGMLNKKLGIVGEIGGKALTGGLVVAGAIAVAEITKKLLEVGHTFAEMGAQIEAATGKSGKQLELLVDDAKKVATTVPASFQDAGKAVAYLSQRLDLTGKPLKTVSEQLLEVSRMTGTDLRSNMEGAATALAKFHVPATETAGALDELFRASQAAQVPFADLATEIAKYGTPLQAFGFNLTRSAAVLDSFHKSGVNVQSAMTGLRIGLGKLAKAGEDPVKGFQETVAAIKDTGSTSEAVAKSVQLFGARAGPELAAAIRSGSLSIGDLTKSIQDGHETILAAGQDTQHFSEQWLLFKNQVAVAVAPVATAMFEAMGNGMKYLNEELPPLIAALKTDLGPTIQAIGRIITDLHPILQIFGEYAVSTFHNFELALKGVLQIVQGVVQLVDALLRGDWMGAWNAAKEIVSGFANVVHAVLNQVVAELRAEVSIVGHVATALGNAVIDGVRSGLSALGALVEHALGAVRSAIAGAVGAAAGAAVALGRAIVSGLASGLAGAAHTAIAAVGSVRSAVVGAFAGAGSWLFGAGQAIVQGLAGGIASYASHALDEARSLAGGVKDAVTGVLGIHSPSTVMIDAGHDTAAGLAQGIKESTQQAVQAAQDMATKVIDAARKPLTASADKLGTLLSHAFDVRQSDVQTPAEKQLQALQDAHDAAQRQQALADAQAQQAAATTDDQQLAAARAVADARYAIQVASLQQEADQQRTALDARQFVQQQAFDSSLASLQAYLESGRATAAAAQAKLTEFMSKWGISFTQLGALLGTSFANGVKSTSKAVEAEAAHLKAVVEDALAAVKRLKQAAASAAAAAPGGSGKSVAGPAPAAAATAGVLAAPATTGAPAGGTLYGTRSPLAGIARAAQSAAALAAPAAQAVPIAVRVFIGEQELTDIVRTEVGYAGDETARILLAGIR